MSNFGAPRSQSDTLGGSEVLDGSAPGNDAARLGERSNVEGRARWERLGELGSGGMGQVTLVRDRLLSRNVALKEPSDEVAAALLHREAMITAALEHPGIVPVYDIGTSEAGKPWFAMRVVRGRSLASVLAAGPSASERNALLRHLLAATEAIAFAHDRGYVHRDLKASNIMIGAFGETQVIDWGLALPPAGTQLAASGLDDASLAGDGPRVAGTPRSMSPEQARGEAVGPPSDVWSLGTILWELLAGRSAFPQGTRDAVLEQVKAGRVPSLAAVAPETPAELVAIVQRAMAPMPADRYPHSKALADDLSRYLAGRRVAAYSYSTLGLLGRIVWAWRVPLLVALVGLGLTTAVLAVSLVRIQDEQARSETSLALALTVEAQRALRVDARGEAEVLASAALVGAATPERARRAGRAGVTPTASQLRRRAAMPRQRYRGPTRPVSHQRRARGFRGPRTIVAAGGAGQSGGAIPRSWQRGRDPGWVRAAAGRQCHG